MHVFCALLLSPFILLGSWAWIPGYYFSDLRQCNDRTLVSVNELRRSDALTCDVDLAGLINGAPFAATFEGRPCGEFGACLTPLLMHALESPHHQQQDGQGSSLAGACGRMWVYHNHWDPKWCSQVVAPDAAPEARWVATWADTEAMWWWLWKGLGCAWCLIALLVVYIVLDTAANSRGQRRRRRQ